MSRLRTCNLALVLFAAVLAVAACTNRPVVQVCDPCGCRCVAAPLVTACGAIPRPEESASAGAASEPADPTKNPRAADIPEWVLSQKRVKGLTWEEVDLGHAVAYLRTLTGLTFFISPKVREEKYDDIVYTMNLDDVSALTVLDVMTRPFGLRHEARGKVIWILTREEVGGPKRLRYFDVKDLIGVEDGFASGAALLEDLHGEVAPEHWDEENAVLEERHGILIVRASGGVLEQLDDYLQARRRALKPYEMPAEIRAKLDATKVQISVSKSTLGDIIKVLQIQTGMNIMVDPRIQSDVSDNPVFGMKLDDVSLSTALNMLAAAAGEHATWIARGDVVVLTLEEYARED